LDESRALDEERVLLVHTMRAQGKRSGVPVEQRMGVVMTLRDGGDGALTGSARSESSTPNTTSCYCGASG
ncbi:MAG: hypothetical protein M3364_02960, partial [Actinomycetota bacterium]|nr:hypothetical protein [Actinomycetota bacterium]